MYLLNLTCKMSHFNKIYKKAAQTTPYTGRRFTQEYWRTLTDQQRRGKTVCESFIVIVSSTSHQNANDNNITILYLPTLSFNAHL